MTPKEFALVKDDGTVEFLDAAELAPLLPDLFPDIVELAIQESCARAVDHAAVTIDEEVVRAERERALEILALVSVEAHRGLDDYEALKALQDEALAEGWAPTRYAAEVLKLQPRTVH